MKSVNKILFSVFLIFPVILFAKEYSLTSPDRKIELTVNDSNGIGFILRLNSFIIFSAEGISMEILNRPATEFHKIKEAIFSSHSGMIRPEIREKSALVPDLYNALDCKLSDQVSIVFRAYNNGVAYRINAEFDGRVTVKLESLSLLLAPNDSVWYQDSDTFSSAYETPYQHKLISDIPEKKLLCLPLLVQKPDGSTIGILESALTDYPGMWLKKDGAMSLKACFSPVPLKEKNEGSVYGWGKVAETADYMAVTSGKREFPWRIFAIAEKDKDLITNQLAYVLADSCRLQDTGWIKPGKVIFDWWARHNIYGVDFKAGINTATARYFIDFCAENGFEYFLFDDGWTNNKNILEYNKDLDMEEISAYADTKNVGLMVWLMWSTFEKQMDEVFDMLEKWKVKGIKVDFMNRDDQKMVNFYHRVAAEASKRNMIVDFHGAYKPSGLRRMYPNVLTREALIEFEYNGWTEYDTPQHHNLLPYIRMLAGPMDYIPGTMNNATRANFRPVGNNPMGQGTRAHFIALCVILESPLMMLPDSPSDYNREKECTGFISKIPVEWDEIRVLGAELGEYTIIARRNGEEWYMGAITDWSPRDFILNFSFLGEGNYKMEYIEDGLNADIRAEDFKKQVATVDNTTLKNIHLAPGGGWVARIFKY